VDQAGLAVLAGAVAARDVDRDLAMDHLAGVVRPSSASRFGRLRQLGQELADQADQDLGGGGETRVTAASVGEQPL
jgi:hypothetical protein